MHKDDPLLHVYTSTQDKLDAMIKQYNLEVQKVIKKNFFLLVFNTFRIRKFSIIYF